MWVEIQNIVKSRKEEKKVALREEGVGRNITHGGADTADAVALREEGGGRNRPSCIMRCGFSRVALRKENVGRGTLAARIKRAAFCML